VSKRPGTNLLADGIAMKSVLVAFGTRPEAIKMAPVVRQLFRSRILKPVLCATAQHREMLDQVTSLFQLKPHFDLNLMAGDQSLAQITIRVLDGVTNVLRETQPAWVLVQGDTTTAFAASLAAFYEDIPVAHVEAGLRSQDKRNPFPEEINRRLISQLADLHFAPTAEARNNLLAEGVRRKKILVTGNTVVDSLCWMLRASEAAMPDLGLLNGADWKNMIPVLVTAHRRENWDKMHKICQAVRGIAALDSRIQLLFPVHANPALQSIVRQELSSSPQVHLLPALPYTEFLCVLNRSRVVVTDSGGVQEEAVSLGKPVVVLRETTERPEIVHSGFGVLAGTSPVAIVQAVERALLKGRSEAKQNPFGDGRASERIVQHLEVCSEPRFVGETQNSAKTRTKSPTLPFTKLVPLGQLFGNAKHANGRRSRISTPG
jgi:UDP-N-acetylglucosamine 2-epimerase (non-hydrolysing)